MSSARLSLLAVGLAALLPLSALAAPGPHLSLCFDTSCASSPAYETAPFRLYVDSTDPLTDFSLAAVTASNATLSDLVPVSGRKYNFLVTPTGQGAVSAVVDTDAVHNGDGAGNVASNGIATTYDSVAPVLTLSSTSTSPTGDPIFVVAASSEDLSGFSAANLTISNGAVSNFSATSPSQYTFLVTPAADGPVSIAVLAGGAADAAGNGTAADATLSAVFSQEPVATLSLLDAASSTVSSITAGSRLAVRITYSEAIDPRSVVSVAVSGASSIASSSATALSDRQYLYVYYPSGSGTDTISVDGAQDLSGNPQIPAAASIAVAALPVAPLSTGGGGGGGGGSSIAGNSIIPKLSSATSSPQSAPNSLSKAASGGEVLGVESYRFTLYLARGSKGDEVQNLQGLLIAGGYLSEDSLSGFFGLATQKALMAYQKANNIPQTGTVGPLTRAKLNSTLPAGPASAAPKSSGLSKTQVQAILGLIQSFGADAKTLAAVAAALK